ncbi:putative Ufm1-specific protease [Capsicum chinense]|nr:putative Ufm1-specific protease [Capsicum chinense]
MIPLFVAIEEEELVCSLLEDLIALADKESGCEIMQMVLNEEVTKLLLVLIDMLVHIGDDPCWGDAINDDGNEGELSKCGYGKESLGRLAIALGGSVIVPNLPSTIFNFLDHEDWKIHYSVVTVIGVISEGCSKVVIHAVGQLSMHMSLQFQEPYHQLVLPDLIAVLDDFDNPRLQSGMTMMNEVALATLGSLAIQSQLLLVIQVKRSMPNTWERITIITMEIGNPEIANLVAKFSCKIINVRSGAELPEKCRELASHFENQETPAMIGRSYSYCNMLLAPSDVASGSISPMNVRISRDDNDPNDIL